MSHREEIDTYEAREEAKARYRELVDQANNYLLELEARMEQAHPILDKLEATDINSYLEAKALYDLLLFQWQRLRIVYLILMLEHPALENRGDSRLQ